METDLTASAPDLDRFRFRSLHPCLSMGTASDRYAGWLGQVYTPERYTGKISSRTKRLGARSFKETILPVESVEEYFEHFDILEIDYTFYALLLDDQGRPTQTSQVLKAYAKHLREGNGLVLKAPQAIFAQKVLRSGKFIPNPGYLDGTLFVQSFYEPATALLGSNLRAIVFEQEYQRKEDRVSPEELAQSLEAFFGSIPEDRRYHVELRTEQYLSRPVLAALERYGVGQVLSHWTWLPPLEKQFERGGRQFLNRGGETVIRLMTPLGVRYEDAYAQAYPFTHLVEGLFQPRMVNETVHLIEEALSRNIHVNLIVNNRAGGNAPEIARLLAARFLTQRSGSPDDRS